MAGPLTHCPCNPNSRLLRELLLIQENQGWGPTRQPCLVLREGSQEAYIPTTKTQAWPNSVDGHGVCSMHDKTNKVSFLADSTWHLLVGGGAGQCQVVRGL